MKSILYTSPTYIKNEIEIITDLVDMGIDYLYIRKPELDDFSLVDFMELIPEKIWRKCISTSLILTKEFNLGGYHFTRDIMQKNKAYCDKILDWLHTNNKISSVSAHTPNNINTYFGNFKHIIVSPLFKSISKENHTYNWELDALKTQLTTLKNNPVNDNLSSCIFAVGGIQKDKINSIKTCNFDGIGILGAIWEHPELAYKTYTDLFTT